MAKRYKLSKSKSKKMFTRGAVKSHRLNNPRNTSHMRGGIRL